MHSAVEKIGRHEQLQRHVRRDVELGDLGGRVGVAHLVNEVLAHLLQHVGPARNTVVVIVQPYILFPRLAYYIIITTATHDLRYLAEEHLVGLVLGVLARAAEHCLDRTGCESMRSLDNELMPITANQLHVHRLRALTATILCKECYGNPPEKVPQHSPEAPFIGSPIFRSSE